MFPKKESKASTDCKDESSGNPNITMKTNPNITMTTYYEEIMLKP